jgi:hypothetical protein
MKTLTKISYVVLLFLGFCIAILTVAYLNLDSSCNTSNQPSFLTRGILNFAIAALSLISGFIAGMITTVSPATKWTRLRGAALAIEAETWRFRTRTGAYVEFSDVRSDGSAGGFGDGCEQVLKARAESIKLQVLKSAGVLNSYFMSYFEMFDKPKHRTIYRHGQYKDCGIQGSFKERQRSTKSLIMLQRATYDSAQLYIKSGTDDFHSPCRPSDYMQANTHAHIIIITATSINNLLLQTQMRVQNQLRFYQARLPAYDRTKNICQTLLVLGSFSGVVLSVFNVSTWAAISASMVGAITAWSEFHMTEEKITRYSDAVTQIDSALLWWKMVR